MKNNLVTKKLKYVACSQTHCSHIQLLTTASNFLGIVIFNSLPTLSERYTLYQIKIHTICRGFQIHYIMNCVHNAEVTTKKIKIIISLFYTNPIAVLDITN